MKITFEEGGDFQVENRRDDQAHSSEEVTAKAARRYGEPPVYFSALKHSSFSNFEQLVWYIEASAERLDTRVSADENQRVQTSCYGFHVCVGGPDPSPPKVGTRP